MSQTRIFVLAAAEGALDPGTVESLRSAWGGTAPRWLSPRQAAEFEAPLPDSFEEARAGLDAQGIDLNAVRPEGRRKRLLLADMDSTMIAQECIDELAVHAGVGERVAAITARAMNGEIGFEGALRERVGLLAGLPVAAINETIADRLTLAPGGRALVATMRAQGARAELVSGGFTAFTAWVVDQLGFDGHRANVLEVERGRLTGGVGEPILGRDAKVERMRDLCAEMGIAAADVLAVGDGANDLGMIRAAGMGVAVHAKPAVQAEAPLRVNHGDLSALLYLQGIARDDFAA
ncbi:phosphoserine phosphatase SerB [Jannaschia sp. Os4]|uniref:phosphoserine phosphatase SerB n=1 Tax=Jannaschia sp. Os4 TaxID=2807617 RepID=UPI00193AC089|nr:phosphoserine phosphatase SerB [Jannaschia sp. Os4]MBM2575875.1 phosphoserine phosphatase SerB [Jannaschia sp. Os4]